CGPQMNPSSQLFHQGEEKLTTWNRPESKYNETHQQCFITWSQQLHV
ncbi:unnamed protein product, partial [Rotaria sp. Silwood2]